MTQPINYDVDVVHEVDLYGHKSICTCCAGGLWCNLDHRSQAICRCWSVIPGSILRGWLWEQRESDSGGGLYEPVERQGKQSYDSRSAF